MWPVVTLPISLSAAIVQRAIGTEDERQMGSWESRLYYPDFFIGSIAIVTSITVFTIAAIHVFTAGATETRYSAKAGAALRDGDFSRAVICYQRLAGLQPDERRFRYFMAAAYEGLGQLERSTAIMHTLAPVSDIGYPRAQLWLAKRGLTDLEHFDTEALRTAESRLIRIRSSPEIVDEANTTLAQLYLLTQRGQFVLNEPALKAAAEKVPELRLKLLQIGVGRSSSASNLRSEALELAAHFRGRLTQSPDDALVRRNLVQTLIILNDFGAAAVVLQEGLTLHPDDKELKATLAAVAVAQAGAAQLQNFTPAARRELARAAVKSLEAYGLPGDMTTLHLAQMQRLSGELSVAEEEFRRIADRIPAARMELAEMLAESGQSQAARDEFEKLLSTYDSLSEQVKQFPGQRLMAGAAALRLHHFAQAEALLVPLAKTDASARRILIEVYLEMFDAEKDQSARLGYLRTAMQWEPYHLPTIRRLLEPLEDPVTHEATRKSLIEMATTGEAPSAVYFLLGTDALRRNDVRTAKQYLEHAARLSPEMPAILNNFAWSVAFGKNPDLNQALGIIDAAVLRAPNDLRIRETRGRILAKIGRYEEAVVELEAALAMLEEDPDFHLLIADVYEHLNMTDLAIGHRRRAVKNDENSVEPVQ